MNLRMMSCCICGEFSGRMEICQQCALMLWPHEIINGGAKELADKLMAVPPPPPASPGRPPLTRPAVHLVDR